VPAWDLARAQTVAEFRGWEPICALQLEYSLVERNVEREPAQLDDNLAALSFELPEPLRRKLDEVTRPETVHPYHFFEPDMQKMMTGGTRLESLSARGGGAQSFASTSSMRARQARSLAAPR
jgi:hypothetical protein